MDIIELLQNRRSVRQYTGEDVPEELLEKVIQAGLLGMTAKNRHSWEFIVVRDPETLKAMGKFREGAGNTVANANCAIVVLGNEEATDVWTEDCSIAMAYMHLTADSLGLGSCWIQGRLRQAPDGRSAEEVLRDVLGFPAQYRLEAILALGIAQQHPEAHGLDHLLTEKVHKEHF